MRNKRTENRKEDWCGDIMRKSTVKIYLTQVPKYITSRNYLAGSGNEPSCAVFNLYVKRLDNHNCSAKLSVFVKL